MDALGAIQKLGSGSLVQELYLALIDVADDVIRTGNNGAVTVTLTVEQAQAGQPTVIVKEAISRRPPKEPSRGAMFFSVDGQLHDRDPRQTVMEFRALDSSEGELRQPADTAPITKQVGD